MMTSFKRSAGAIGKLGRRLWLVLVLFMPSMASHVDSSMAAPMLAPADRPVTYVVDGPIGLVSLPVLAGEDSWLEFPSDVRNAYTARNYPDFAVERLYQRVRIRAAPGATTGGEMRVYVDSATVQVDVLVHVVASRDQAVRVGEIKTRSSIETAETHIDSAVERVIKERDERERQYRRKLLRAALDPPMVPANGDGRSDSGPVELQIVRATRSVDDLNVFFDLTNQRSNSMAIAEVRAFIDGQRQTEKQTVIVDLPTGGDGVVARVPPKGRLRGVVSVPGGATHGIRPLSLAIDGPQGLRLTMAAVTDWTANQDVIHFLSSDPNKEKDAAAADRITLDVQALYGAIWLSAGTGLDELGAASLSGLGVRVGYGINRLLTFEGAAVGARSGDVCFMTPTGELERSVMLGRIYMGGLLRFGERFMPTARLGVGLQGALQRSTMVDGSMDESAFEIGLLLGAGVGLEVRLSKSLLLGLGVSVEGNLISAGEASFESGIHLGYAWKP